MSDILFTDACIGKVAELIAEENDSALSLRVFVQGGGCSGFSYGFTFDSETGEDDFTFEHSGVKFVVDSISMQYLAGATVDFVDDITGTQFVIRNPNASSTCGCGSSFSV